MSKHPLWSICHTVYIVHMEVTVRNEKSQYPQWLPVALFVWLLRELKMLGNDAARLETEIMQACNEIASLPNFRDRITHGMLILRKYTDYLERRIMEDRVEEIYRRCLRNRKPNLDSTDAIKQIIYDHLKGSDMLPEDIDEAVVYSQYRHCEFIKTITATCNGRVYTVTLTMFAYKLPEKKPVEDWVWHKCSMLIQSPGLPDKYQTCRWKSI